MFLKLLDICNRHGLRFELILDPSITEYVGGTLRLTSRDGIRIIRNIDEHELTIVREDPDEYVTNYILPTMIDGIEKYRKERRCV